MVKFHPGPPILVRTMKLVSQPEIVIESIRIDRDTARKIFKDKSINDDVLMPGKMIFPEIQFEDCDFDLNEKVSEITIDNYTFYGIIPISRIGNITTCLIDYFEVHTC